MTVALADLRGAMADQFETVTGLRMDLYEPAAVQPSPLAGWIGLVEGQPDTFDKGASHTVHAVVLAASDLARAQQALDELIDLVMGTLVDGPLGVTGMFVGFLRYLNYGNYTIGGHEYPGVTFEFKAGH